MKIRRPFRFIVITIGVAMVLYLGAFMCRFEVFSSPVRDNAQGWLGPRMRGDCHSVDIGKVYYYEGTDFSSYLAFRPLYSLWLLAMGY